MSDDDQETPGAEVVPYSELESALLDARVRMEDDPEAAQRAIMERILSATTPEEVLSDDEVTPAQEMLETPFVLVGVRFLNSTYEGEGLSVYAILDGASDQGEKLLISCGARKVIGKAFRLATMGELPRRVMIVEARNATARGYRPLNLVDAKHTPAPETDF